jgi:hypothetical protein
MFPLLTFRLCFVCLAHIERCHWLGFRWSLQVPTHLYDVLPLLVKQKVLITNCQVQSPLSLWKHVQQM